VMSEAKEKKALKKEKKKEKKKGIVGGGNSTMDKNVLYIVAGFIAFLLIISLWGVFSSSQVLPHVPPKDAEF